MENEKQILVVGNPFGIGVTGLVQFAQTKDHKAELIEQIKATGYTFDLEPEKLADYLISECDNFNLNNRTSFDYSEFFQLYLNERPQYKKDMTTQFKGLLAIDEIKTAFTELGKSLKVVSIRLGDLNIEPPKTNTKWYNQFKKRRKR